MYLLINTAITNKRLAPHKPIDTNRLDIFKYSLASLSSMPFDKVFIYYEFYNDEDFKSRENELRQYIEQEFKNTELYLFNYRNTNQKQWQSTLLPLLDYDKNSIFYICNDDHVFIDSNLETINSAVEIIENTDDNIAMYLSHWPEMNKISFTRGNNRYNKYFQYWEDINYDSILLMHKNILKDWWFNHDYGDSYMPRSDWFNGTTVRGPKLKILNPIREQFRHFEGYPHVGNTDCPSLNIPTGFFENNINISFYEHVENYTNMPDDFIFHHLDIPLFWKNKIKQFHIGNIPNNIKETRLQNLIKIANSSPNYNSYFNEELLRELYSI